VLLLWLQWRLQCSTSHVNPEAASTAAIATMECTDMRLVSAIMPLLVVAGGNSAHIGKAYLA
jgi:hypothetical protein